LDASTCRSDCSVGRGKAPVGVKLSDLEGDHPAIGCPDHVDAAIGPPGGVRIAQRRVCDAEHSEEPLDDGPLLLVVLVAHSSKSKHELAFAAMRRPTQSAVHGLEMSARSRQNASQRPGPSGWV